MEVSISKRIESLDWGLIPYRQAWDKQTEIFQQTITLKNKNRETNTVSSTPNYIIFCEHPHVFTLGNSGEEKNLLITPQEVEGKNAEWVKTNRGGDITYHGPGQLVVYPILDLENFFTDIHRYMRSLEEAVIRTLHTFGITATREKGLTGVWVQDQGLKKICAMGVKTSRWVTMHGLALNVNSDLNYFSYIVPCGLSDKGVTSMHLLLGKAVSMHDVKMELKKNLWRVFEAE